MRVRNVRVPKDELSRLCQRWQIEKLALFGSVLRDDFRADSDIDVLVEFAPNCTPGFIKLYQIEEELSALFDHRDIDLVTFKALNHRLRDRILDSAEVCYVAER